MHELAFWAQGWGESSDESKLYLDISSRRVREDTDVEFCSFIRVVVHLSLVLVCNPKSTVRYGTSCRYLSMVHSFL
jgi:hypothetical protein